MLKKINWKFRKTHIRIIPITFFVNDNWNGWGFDLLNISYNLLDSSLLKLVCTLPNSAEKKLLFSGDFLFLRNYLLNMLSDLEESLLWSNTLTKWERLKYRILKGIFK